MERAPRTGWPALDSMLMAWGSLLTVAQSLGVGALNAYLGVAVGVATLVLLVYRILLAHEEYTDLDG